MLLEMQNAMNNMMSNSHSNQPLPISNQISATDGDSEDSTGHSSRSSSTSPRSNRSKTSPDPKLLITMDMSQSSDSFSATDSGEEEAIGKVTRAQQETFMYNQEQGSVPFEAPNNYSYFTGKTQDVWNRQNDTSSLSEQKPHSSCAPQGTEESSQHYSTLSSCPVRLPNSIPDGTSLQNLSPRANNDNETHANGSYGLQTFRRVNRMHLVSYTGYQYQNNNTEISVVHTNTLSYTLFHEIYFMILFHRFAP